MLFWLIAALLTLGASLSVLLPLSARREESADGASHDLRVYKDQLAEVERDRDAGLLGSAEAQEARAEIGRQILRLDRASAARNAPSSKLKLLGAAAVFFVPLMSWGVYAAVGSPDLPAQPLEARLSKPADQSSVEELVARAERTLRANPDDGRGWDMIGPIYLRLQKFDDAAGAFRQAIRLLGSSPEREIGVGEALAAAGGGKISAEAEAAYKRAVALQPENARARFRLAAAAAQQGRTTEAVEAWNAMLPGLPAGSPWRAAIAQAVSGVGATGSPVASGPTSEDMKAAEGLPEADRAAMVERMVASLDQRLRTERGTAEEWLRLVRSYRVLGRTGDADDALRRGLSALGEGSAEAKSLAAAARASGEGASPL